jgi:hypothetical protein
MLAPLCRIVCGLRVSELSRNGIKVFSSHCVTSPHPYSVSGIKAEGALETIVTSL